MPLFYGSGCHPAVTGITDTGDGLEPTKKAGPCAPGRYPALSLDEPELVADDSAADWIEEQLVAAPLVEVEQSTGEGRSPLRYSSRNNHQRRSQCRHPRLLPAPRR